MQHEPDWENLPPPEFHWVVKCCHQMRDPRLDTKRWHPASRVVAHEKQTRYCVHCGRLIESETLDYIHHTLTLLPVMIRPKDAPRINGTPENPAPGSF